MASTVAMNGQQMSGNTSELLPAERARASFDVPALMSILGTDKRLKQVTRARKLFEAHETFDQHAEMLEKVGSYSENFERSLARTVEAVKITRDNPSFMMQHMAGKVQMQDMFETNGVASIHYSMFLTFLKTNASEEQKKKWLPGALEANYFGAYAQTELGHGSNVRGLETIATFDKETDEFIIHSPTLTSMKWWPTGMYACTHAIVFANLILDGQPRGVHGFMVQLRDHEGMLMPGIEVGEIGPKIMGGHTNIGYAAFRHIRVPRFNMFSKLYQVTASGEFIAPPPKVGKIKNISMMVMRVFNVAWAARDLAKASTIACRYSAVRRQGFRDTTSMAGQSQGENVILDYQNQQYRVFKGISLAYMLLWNQRYLKDYLDDVQAKITAGDMSVADELQPLHVTCSGLKAYSTVEGHANIEELRKSVGGQGFLRSSGLPDLVASLAEPVTVEGEQIILSLQVGRFLIKTIRGTRAGAAAAGVSAYLLDEPLGALPPTTAGPAGTAWMSDPDTLVLLLKDRARRVAYKLEKRFSAAEASGKTFDQATNSNAILSYKSARCHSSYVAAHNNLQAIKNYLSGDAAIRAVMLKLFQLQVCMIVHEQAADFIGVIGPDHVDGLLDRIEALLGELRPEAVSLCDAFGYDDYNLKSAIGRYDGNVYEAIYKEAKANPMNASPKMLGWEKLETIFDMAFLKEGVGQRVAAPAAKL